jgi:hypothetical protein
LPIVVISFCWDTAEHPDPKGLQLDLIGRTLRAEREKYRKANYAFRGFSEMGVFWDWGSLLQGDRERFEAAKAAALERGCSEEDASDAGWKDFRTPSEKAAFDFALHETMDLWYAHQGTTVFLLTQHPRERGSDRPKGYDESGWTTYERCSAEQVKKVYRFQARWGAVLDLGQESVEAAGRRWPVGPDDFDAKMETCVFTNGSDKDVVKGLFRKMSASQLGGIAELDFTGLPPPSDDDAARLGRCLNLCTHLKQLDLSDVKLSPSACRSMCEQLTSEALPELQELDLSRYSSLPSCQLSMHL